MTELSFCDIAIEKQNSISIFSSLSLFCTTCNCGIEFSLLPPVIQLQRVPPFRIQTLASQSTKCDILRASSFDSEYVRCIGYT